MTPSRPGRGVCVRLLAGIAIAIALATSGHAAEVPDLQAPFTGAATETIASPVRDATWQATLADRAVEAGYYHLAEGVYRRELERAAAGSAERERLALGLITTLIGQGKRAEAAAELAAFADKTSAPWVLRRAMLDLVVADYEQLAARLPQIDGNALPAADAAWVHFLRAMLADHELDRSEADAEFARALATSTSAAASAWFGIARFQMQFNVGEATTEAESELRQRMSNFAGQPQGFEATLQYAALLDRLGRRSGAAQALQRLQAALPPTQVDVRDRTWLLLGLIAGTEAAEGEEALRQVLQRGTNVAWRRVALQRLAAGPPAVRANVVRLIDTLLTANADDPLAEDLYFFGAELALRTNTYERVNDYAGELLRRFPGSSLTAAARALLASAAWQRKNFRVAADNVSRIRDELPADASHAVERARLAVLMGESHYQAARQAGTAEDYRNAAQAYGVAQEEIARLDETTRADAAFAENTVGASLGEVFLRRVLATIRSGAFDRAGELVLGPEATQADATNRWSAAWNLVRFLQLEGRAEDAFRRIEQLNAATDAPPELRLQFLWLAAQLTLEANRPAATAERAAAVRAFLASEAGSRVDADRRAEVESALALLEAQAYLGLAAAATVPAEQERLTQAGIAEMEKLRTSHRGSRAAVYSYIVQSRYLAEAGQLVAAQRLLQDLVAQYPDSEYARLALFEAAELSVKRGGDTYLKEALDLLKPLAEPAPGAREDYVFIARLKQGDILREIRRFADAEQAYRDLENRFPNHPDIAVVRLRLASTMLAQAADNPAKFEPAITLLERLTELPSADTDLRAEAGFNLGYAWETHGNADRAAEIYWGVYLQFLGQPTEGTRPPGANGNYWIARALLYFAEIEQAADRTASAIKTYEVWARHQLPGAAIAEDRLRALRAGG